MEGDDAARPSVALDIIQYVISSEQTTVISGHYIPHYHFDTYMS